MATSRGVMTAVNDAVAVTNGALLIMGKLIVSPIESAWRGVRVAGGRLGDGVGVLLRVGNATAVVAGSLRTDGKKIGECALPQLTLNSRPTVMLKRRSCGLAWRMIMLGFLNQPCSHG
jgi:hypothetical protein